MTWATSAGWGTDWRCYGIAGINTALSSKKVSEYSRMEMPTVKGASPFASGAQISREGSANVALKCGADRVGRNLDSHQAPSRMLSGSRCRRRDGKQLPKIRVAGLTTVFADFERLGVLRRLADLRTDPSDQRIPAPVHFVAWAPKTIILSLPPAAFGSAARDGSTRPGAATPHAMRDRQSRRCIERSSSEECRTIDELQATCGRYRSAVGDLAMRSRHRWANASEKRTTTT